MPKKGGRRVRIKKLRYQINQAIIFNRDPLKFIYELDKLLIQPSQKPKEQNKYKLIRIDFKINFPHFKNIKKKDPRYQTYKIRYLFGED